MQSREGKGEKPLGRRVRYDDKYGDTYISTVDKRHINRTALPFTEVGEGSTLNRTFAFLMKLECQRIEVLGLYVLVHM